MPIRPEMRHLYPPPREWREPFATHWTRLLEPEAPTRDQALGEP